MGRKKYSVKFDSANDAVKAFCRNHTGCINCPIMQYFNVSPADCVNILTMKVDTEDSNVCEALGITITEENVELSKSEKKIVKNFKGVKVKRQGDWCLIYDDSGLTTAEISRSFFPSLHNLDEVGI